MAPRSDPSQAKRHIEEIRREQRGEFTGSNRRGFKERALQAALRKLADELYDKRPHFLLELIQNAEDNSYAQSVSPALEFHLLPDDPMGVGEEGCLCVFNNETGFEPRNVTSICSIAESTKTKREGYVGEKGIGFKSVFLATDQPHIFSPPYQFCFSKAEDPEVGFGYIVPTWIGSAPARVREAEMQTAILLPLQSGVRDQIAEGLRGVAAETILFLRKLHSLNLRDVAGNWQLNIAREPARGAASV